MFLPKAKSLPSVAVPVTTLDELVGGDVPTVMKIDVEGHEAAVLEGARKTLRDSRLLAVVMETNGSGARYGVSDKILIAMMCEAGFSASILRSVFPPLVRRRSSGNTLFVRDVAVVNERIRSAPRYKLVNGSI